MRQYVVYFPEGISTNRTRWSKCTLKKVGRSTKWVKQIYIVYTENWEHQCLRNSNALCTCPPWHGLDVNWTVDTSNGTQTGIDCVIRDIVRAHWWQSVTLSKRNSVKFQYHWSVWQNNSNDGVHWTQQLLFLLKIKLFILFANKNCEEECLETCAAKIQRLSLTRSSFNRRSLPWGTSPLKKIITFNIKRMNSM